MSPIYKVYRILIFIGFYIISVQATGRLLTLVKCKPPGRCVEIRDCPFFSEMLDRSPKPRTFQVIEIIRTAQCGFYKNTPKVCCYLQYITEPTTTSILPSTTSTTLNVAESRESESFKAPIIDLRSHPNFKFLPNDICGEISSNNRITGGSKTTVSEFPWMALLAFNTSEGLDFRCGGTVISERFVLTAAHCVVNTTVVGVRLGEYNLYTQEDCDPVTHHCAPPVQDFWIDSIIVHPKYNPELDINDIALIKLGLLVNFKTENVKPICLPVGEAAGIQLTGKSATVSGWGMTEHGFRSPELLRTDIPVISTEECRGIYKRAAHITDSQICAGGVNGRDSCGGDSGGPLKYVGLVDGTIKYIQYGIVSYGPKHCGIDGQPGIYTRVTSFMNWILDNLQQQNNTEKS